jgi:hypothetical protein
MGQKQTKLSSCKYCNIYSQLTKRNQSIDVINTIWNYYYDFNGEIICRRKYKNQYILFFASMNEKYIKIITGGLNTINFVIVKHKNLCGNNNCVIKNFVLNSKKCSFDVMLKYKKNFSIKFKKTILSCEFIKLSNKDYPDGCLVLMFEKELQLWNNNECKYKIIMPDKIRSVHINKIDYITIDFYKNGSQIYNINTGQLIATLSMGFIQRIIKLQNNEKILIVSASEIDIYNIITKTTETIGIKNRFVYDKIKKYKDTSIEDTIVYKNKNYNEIIRIVCAKTNNTAVFDIVDGQICNIKHVDIKFETAYCRNIIKFISEKRIIVAYSKIIEIWDIYTNKKILSINTNEEYPTNVIVFNNKIISYYNKDVPMLSSIYMWNMHQNSTKKLIFSTDQRIGHIIPIHNYLLVSTIFDGNIFILI